MDAKWVGRVQLNPPHQPSWLTGLSKQTEGNFSGKRSSFCVEFSFGGKSFWKFEGNIPGEKAFVDELSGKYSPLSNLAI